MDGNDGRNRICLVCSIRYMNEYRTWKNSKSFPGTNPRRYAAPERNEEHCKKTYYRNNHSLSCIGYYFAHCPSYSQRCFYVCNRNLGIDDPSRIACTDQYSAFISRRQTRKK